MKQFHIGYKNSSRWVEQGVTFDPRYNDVPFDYQTDLQNYKQPRQFNDVEYIQFLSDWVPTLKYYNSCTGELYKTITLTQPPISIIGNTFTCYEATVDFSDWLAGTYIGKIAYTDDDNNLKEWACTPIDLREKHYRIVNGQQVNSILLTYSNSENDQDGIIWDTGIVMNLRFEGIIGKFQPKANREQYDDQYMDGLLLDGIPYRWQELTLMDFDKIGLPDWFLDKVNRIFSECDNTMLNAVNYIAVEDELKLSRPDGGINQDAYATMMVQEVPNPTFGKLETGDLPDDSEYIIMPKPLEFKNKGASFSFANVFNINTSLEHIVIYNEGADAFDMLIGTGEGLQDIAKVRVKAAPEDSFKLINHLFKVPTTVYITIPDGVNISGFIKWMKYDLPNINVNPVQPTPYLPGNIYFYAPLDPDDYATQFDNAGVGVPGSAHEGCVVCGTNGYYDGYDWQNMTLLHGLLGDIGEMSNDGSWTLSKSQLPAEGVGMFGDGPPNPTPNDVPTGNQHAIYAARGGGPLEYQIRRAADNANINIGKTANLGDGAAIDKTPKGIYGVFFTYIG
jgi:hypothetical protein